MTFQSKFATQVRITQTSVFQWINPPATSFSMNAFFGNSALYRGVSSWDVISGPGNFKFTLDGVVGRPAADMMLAERVHVTTKAGMRGFTLAAGTATRVSFLLQLGRAGISR